MATQTKSKNKSKAARRAPAKRRKNPTASKKAPTIDPKNLEVLRALRAWDNFTPEEMKNKKQRGSF